MRVLSDIMPDMYTWKVIYQWALWSYHMNSMYNLIRSCYLQIYDYVLVNAVAAFAPLHFEAFDHNELLISGCTVVFLSSAGSSAASSRVKTDYSVEFTTQL